MPGIQIGDTAWTEKLKVLDGAIGQKKAIFQGSEICRIVGQWCSAIGSQAVGIW